MCPNECAYHASVIALGRPPELKRRGRVPPTPSHASPNGMETPMPMAKPIPTSLKVEDEGLFVSRSEILFESDRDPHAVGHDAGQVIPLTFRVPNLVWPVDLFADEARETEA
jgi:hypothetical protein